MHLAPLSLPRTMPAAAPAEVLDRAARGTHVLLKAALDAGVRHVVLGSTLALMDAYPDDLEVTEQWRPRPRPRPTELAPYLAELTAREFTRDVQLDDPPRIVCLRFAEGLDPALAAGAVQRALAGGPAGVGARPPRTPAPAGAPLAALPHRPARPRRPLHLRPRQQSLGYGQEAESAAAGAWRGQMKLVLYGAGGPVAAAAIAELEQHHTLRLTDVRPPEVPHPRQRGPRPGRPLAGPAPPQRARVRRRGRHPPRSRCSPPPRGWTPSSTSA